MWGTSAVEWEDEEGAEMGESARWRVQRRVVSGEWEAVRMQTRVCCDECESGVCCGRT